MMKRWIRGKYDSLWKRNPSTGRLDRGTFSTAMDHARKVRGGIGAIQHIRNQPWESWQKNNTSTNGCH
jgi:hypothetical protein